MVEFEDHRTDDCRGLQRRKGGCYDDYQQRKGRIKKSHARGTFTKRPNIIIGRVVDDLVGARARTFGAFCRDPLTWASHSIED